VLASVREALVNTTADISTSRILASVREALADVLNVYADVLTTIWAQMSVDQPEAQASRILASARESLVNTPTVDSLTARVLESVREALAEIGEVEFNVHTTITGLISVDEPETLFICKLDANRDALSSVPAPETSAQWTAAFTRVCNDSVKICNILCGLGTGLIVSALMQCGTPEINAGRRLGFLRASDSEVSESQALTSYVLSSVRESGVSVEHIDIVTDRVLSSIRAMAAVMSPEILATRTLDSVRSAENSIPYILSVQASRDLTFSRTGDVFVDVPKMDTSTATSIHADASVDVFVGMPFMLAERLMVYRREAGYTVPILENVAGRVLELNREMSGSVLTPEILAAYIAHYADRPITRPFFAELDKLLFYAEYSKPLYFAVIRDGDTMFEITQLDSDTFTGALYDTDPVTEERRLFPLTNCTVKAVLKGGIHSTTITKDCTILGDGSVRFALTSADTAVPGSYSCKFIVLGQDGFRKELPESLSDVQKIRINDKAYDQ
jgi:hypothetical protein